MTATTTTAHHWAHPRSSTWKLYLPAGTVTVIAERDRVIVWRDTVVCRREDGKTVSHIIPRIARVFPPRRYTRDGMPPGRQIEQAKRWVEEQYAA